MTPLDQMPVLVQADWKAWQTAEVRLRDVEDVHWLQPGQAPHSLIHGYIRCTDIVAGSIPHDCRTRPPHRLLVCVIKKHVPPTAFEELARRANLQGAPLVARSIDQKTRSSEAIR